MLLKDSHVNSVSEDRQRLAVVLSRLTVEEHEEAVLQLLAKEAGARLPWCCHLFKEEALNLQACLFWGTKFGFVLWRPSERADCKPRGITDTYVTLHF